MNALKNFPAATAEHRVLLEIVLLTVDRGSIVSYYEGSNLSAGASGTQPYAKGHFIGKHLREVWPSNKLLAAVEDIFASNRVSRITRALFITL